MIGKVITGKSFAGCIAYNLQRAEASLLEVNGVRSTSIKSMIADFNMQRKLNPNLGQAVGHIVLSWSVADKGKLTESIMIDRAKEYMQKMQIKDTQYMIVQHTDREHPHLHLVYNRVSNSGKTITDRYQKVHNVRVCKELTLKYGYHLAEGKAAVNRQRLKGSDQLKYELYDAVSSALKQSDSWQQLATLLQKKGIQLHYKYLSGSNTVQGVSFSKGETKLKGSEIDRSLSYANINKQIDRNRTKAVEGERLSNTCEGQIPHVRLSSRTSNNIPSSMIHELLKQEPQSDAMPFEWQKRKRKLRKGRQI